MDFECDKCGACCRNIGLSSLLADFDNGAGQCIHLTAENLCDIYENRPLCCNVEKLYYTHFSHLIDEHEWIRLNRESCLMLKQLDASRT